MKKINTIEIVAILVSYVVIFGVLFGVVFATANPILIWIYMAISFIAYIKLTNTGISNFLSRFIWPVWLIGTILFGCTIGTFVLPYHLGKWVGKKINEQMNKKS
ncbi:MAG: hypothetical protein ACI4HO_00760 [Ruminococcus sp.]